MKRANDESYMYRPVSRGEKVRGKKTITRKTTKSKFTGRRRTHTRTHALALLNCSNMFVLLMLDMP